MKNEYFLNGFEVIELIFDCKFLFKFILIVYIWMFLFFVVIVFCNVFWELIEGFFVIIIVIFDVFGWLLLIDVNMYLCIVLIFLVVFFVKLGFYCILLIVCCRFFIEEYLFRLNLIVYLELKVIILICIVLLLILSLFRNCL